jgi:hypothetical protein
MRHQAGRGTRPETAQAFRRSPLLHSRLNSSIGITPRIEEQSSVATLLPNTTLLSKLLLNRGREVRMPQASTFMRKNMIGQLSKDQMLLLSQSSKSRYISSSKMINQASMENKKYMDSYLDSLIVN